MVVYNNMAAWFVAASPLPNSQSRRLKKKKRKRGKTIMLRVLLPPRTDPERKKAETEGVHLSCPTLLSLICGSDSPCSAAPRADQNAQSVVFLTKLASGGRERSDFGDFFFGSRQTFVSLGGRNETST